MGWSLAAAVQEKFTVWVPRGPGQVAVALAGAPGTGVAEFVEANGALSPPGPSATMENEYAVPTVPSNVVCDTLPTFSTAPPGFIVMRYPVMLRPLPFAPLQSSTTLPEPSFVALTVALVTGNGAPYGRACALGSESSPVPTAFVARTWNVYAVPFA